MTTKTTKTTEAENTMDDISREATAAFDDATRIVSQTARRSADAARASVDRTRSFMDETSELGAEHAGAWATAGETALKSVFGAQNAALDLSTQVLDLTTKANRRALGQLAELVGEGQKTALAGLLAGVTAFERMTVDAGRNGKAPRR